MSLCGRADRVDDLVQETMLRAITRIDSFQPGTNLGAWLTTILRNCFLSDLRKRRNEVEDADGAYALCVTSGAGAGTLVGIQGISRRSQGDTVRSARGVAAGGRGGAVLRGYGDDLSSHDRHYQESDQSGSLATCCAACNRSFDEMAPIARPELSWWQIRGPVRHNGSFDGRKLSYSERANPADRAVRSRRDAYRSRRLSCR